MENYLAEYERSTEVIEIEAEDVTDALDKAAEEFGVYRDKVTVSKREHPDDQIITLEDVEVTAEPRRNEHGIDAYVVEKDDNGRYYGDAHDVKKIDELVVFGLTGETWHGKMREVTGVTVRIFRPGNTEWNYMEVNQDPEDLNRGQG